MCPPVEGVPVSNGESKVDLRKEIMQTALEEFTQYYGQNVHSLSAIQAAGAEYACRVRFDSEDDFEEFSIFLEDDVLTLP